jgi:hypothetical protein
MILVARATGHAAVAAGWRHSARRGGNGRGLPSRIRRPPSIALRVADYEGASAQKRALAGIDDMLLISGEWRCELIMRCPEPNVRRARATRGTWSGQTRSRATTWWPSSQQERPNPMHLATS